MMSDDTTPNPTKRLPIKPQITKPTKKEPYNCSSRRYRMNLSSEEVRTTEVYSVYTKADSQSQMANSTIPSTRKDRIDPRSHPRPNPIDSLGKHRCAQGRESDR